MNAGCEGAPLLPLLYVITNLSFNITVLSVVKKFSAVVASLVVMLSGSFFFYRIYELILDIFILYAWAKGWSCWLYAVPISIYILSLPLPYLPEGASLSPLFLTGSLMLVLGLVFYYIPQRSKEGTKIDWCYYYTGLTQVGLAWIDSFCSISVVARLRTHFVV